jgi:SAM-dependent methyltransferase
MRQPAFERLRAWHQILSGASSVDVRRVALSLAGIPSFLTTAVAYRRLSRGGPFELRLRDIYPITADRYLSAGTASGHYFHQDLWAARKIFAKRPARHVDVGSRIDGFVAHLLVFTSVEVVDIRPLGSHVESLTFVRGNGESLDCFADESIDSLSSLHALEHFGLGRYGDPVNPGACFRAMNALARVLRPGGRLYVGVPIGRERVEFNAQRVFAPSTVLEGFRGLDSLSFSAVDDEGNLRVDADPQDFSNSRYACGLFEFTKSASRR